MNKFIAFVVLTLVVGFGIGFYAGNKIASSKYTSQIEKVKSFFPSTPDTPFISGTVKGVSGNVVTLETVASSNPFEELPTVRQVTVGSDAKIIKQVSKDPSEFQKEMTAWQKSSAGLKPGTLPIAVPQSFTEKEIKVSELKAGDIVSVGASDNIKTKISFKAITITVLTQTQTGLPSAPATIPAGSAVKGTLPPPPPASSGLPSKSTSPSAAPPPVKTSKTPTGTVPGTSAVPPPPAPSSSTTVVPPPPSSSAVPGGTVPPPPAPSSSTTVVPPPPAP